MNIDLEKIVTDATDEIIQKRDEQMLIWTTAYAIIKSACEKAWHEGYLEGHKVASDFARKVQQERNELSRAAQEGEKCLDG